MASDVIGDTMRWLIPSSIKQFCPIENYEQSHSDIFEMALDGILSKGLIPDKATKHLVIDSTLGCCRNEKHYKMII